MFERMLTGLRVRAASAFLMAALSPAAGALPNVVFILGDDVGYGDIGPYKNATSPIPTPNIDQIAAQGMTFTDAHTVSSVCAPSRYSLLTGNYAFRGRVIWGIWIYNLVSDLLPGQKTIGDVMQAAGYDTAFIGKLHLGGDFYAKNSNEFYRGSDTSQVDFTRRFRNGPLDHGFNYSYLTTNGIQAEPYAFFENDKFLPINPAQNQMVYWNAGTYGDSVISQSGYGDPNWDSSQVGPRFVQKAIDFIDRHVAQYGTQKPFLLYFSSQAIHEPYTPSDTLGGIPVAGETGVDAKADIIYEFDVQVGRLVNALNQHGLTNNTLIIVTSDNGGTQTTRHLNVGHDSVGGLRGRKTLIYEGGHRVPFIAKWGDGTPAGSMIVPGSVSDQFIGVHDWVAAMYALTGQTVQQDQALDSANILPIMLGQQPATTPVRNDLVLQAAHWGDNAYWRGIRVDNWELALSAQETPIELYNLLTDPQQTTNLISSPQQQSRIDSLMARYDYVAHQSTRSVPVASNCGPPTYNAATEAGVFIWQDCVTGMWNVRMTAGPNYRLYTGDVVSDQPFTSVIPVSVETGDILDTSNPREIRYSLGMRVYEDGFNFQYPAGANVCFNVATPASAVVYAGPTRTPVSVPFNPQTLGPCGGTQLPTLSINNVTVAEDAGTANFTVSLSAPSAQTVSVNVASANGTATAGSDYVAVSQNVTFQPGQTARTVSVTILDDAQIEGDETFHMNLSGAINAVVGTASGTGTITDDELSACGAPNYNAATERAIFLWKDCAADIWRARFTAGPNFTRYVGTVSSTQAFTYVAGVSLEAADTLDYLSNPRLISFTLSMVNYEDGFDFSFPAGASVCLGVTSPANASLLLGPNRIPVTLPFSPSTLAPC